MSDTLSLLGKIKLINKTEEFSSGFTKRTFVITTDDKYPQEVQFELVKDKTSLIDGKKVGDEVEVLFNVRGNEYNGRYYVSLQAWKLLTGEQESKPSGNKKPKQTAPQNEDFDDEDDIPF